jgi:hypothetical protein
VRDRDPVVPAAVFQPLLVGAIGWEQIGMTLDSDAGFREDAGNCFPRSRSVK